ncbi:MAG: response regulator transcription factor [Candidatus Sulfotelmatobacter sp.]
MSSVTFQCLVPLPLLFAASFQNEVPREGLRDNRTKSNTNSLKVLLVEDHALARKTFCEMLRDELGVDTVSEAANGLEGVSAAQELQPDITLLDVTMPALGGIEAAVRIRQVAPKTRIVFLSQHDSYRLAQAALATGAQGYVVKSAAATDLAPAIHAALAGEKFVSKLTEWPYSR